MKTVKKDTVITIKRRINPDSIKYLIQDEVFTAKGDTLLFVRDIPSGMLYTAERAREHKVRVKWDAPIGGSPVGYMVFDSTAKYTSESVLMLDGQWQPIDEPYAVVESSDKIQPSDLSVNTPERFIIETPAISPKEKTHKYDSYVDAFSLEILIGFTIYLLLNMPELIKSKMTGF